MTAEHEPHHIIVTSVEDTPNVISVHSVNDVSLGSEQPPPA